MFFKTIVRQNIKMPSLSHILYELSTTVLNNEENKLNNIHTVDKLFYVDTPMPFPVAFYSSFNKYWIAL